MTEIDLDNDQRNAERGGTAATDIQLEAEQRATQALHVHQVAFHAAADADTKGMALPSLQLYSDLPREWPMARLHLQQASQPACPDIPLAESGRKRTPWYLLWEHPRGD